MPVEIPAGTRIAAVQLGCGFALALTSTGGILAWGTNNSGTLGSGSSAQRSLVPVPVKLPAGVTVKAISAGDDFSLALTTGSRVLAWGSDLVGELGDGRHHDHSSVPVPVKLAAGIKVTELATGDSHSLVLTSAGRAMSWGANGEGQLGDGKPGNRATPVRVKLPSGSRVTALAAGNAHSLALTTSGRVLAWGNDRSGELGNGSTHNRLSPVRVKLPSGTKVTAISV